MKKLKSSKLLHAILLIAIIATAIVPIGSFTAYAADESDFTYVSFGGSASIQKYNGNAENVEIPNTLGGNTVTTIDDNAFKNCTNIKSITIPSTVTRIDSSAFEGCINLESVNIPSAVTYIGSRVFYGCESLKDITVPSSVTYIGPEVFAYCSALTQINVGSNNKGYISVDGVLFDIGKTRLMQYPAAKDGDSYTVPSSVRYINQSAFAGCSRLTSITLSSSLSYIYDKAFIGCSGLKSITIPSNVTSINALAFDGCTALENIEVVKENSHFTSKDGILFNKSETKLIRYPSAKKDTTYTIPKTVTSVEQGAFADCINLTSVVIHKTLCSFGDEAFRGCSNLTEIILTYSTTHIGKRVFEGCTSLKSITMGTQNIYYSSKDGVLFDKEKTKIIFYPIAKEDTSYTIPDSVTTIDERAFVNPSNLTSLVIPNSVTSIKANSFVDCETLTIYAKSNSYAYKYALENGLKVVDTDIVKNVSHTVSNGKIIFTVTTKAGDYDRVKLTTPDNLSGSLAVASTYTVNDDGDYVWTVKATAPKVAANYAFDFRSSETGRYLKDYFNYEAEIVSNIKSVTYEKSNGKVIFTVTTRAGEFGRVKATLANDLAGYVAYSDNYVINADGDYIWTITANAPLGEQEYAFDLRSSETGKYNREYIYCTVEPTIKSAYYIKSGDILTFTVTTTAGDFDRLRCGVSTSTLGNLANANYYTVNSNGDYVWTFKLTIPSEDTLLYLDLRNSNTGKFLKDLYIFNYTV